MFGSLRRAFAVGSTSTSRLTSHSPGTVASEPGPTGSGYAWKSTDAIGRKSIRSSNATGANPSSPVTSSIWSPGPLPSSSAISHTVGTSATWNSTCSVSRLFCVFGSSAMLVKPADHTWAVNVASPAA